jgi:hypothetical protein
MVHPGYRIDLVIEAGFFSLRAAMAAVFPIQVVRGPENSIWVVDEGDFLLDPSITPRGQVFRFDPGFVGLGLVNDVQ